VAQPAAEQLVAQLAAMALQAEKLAVAAQQAATREDVAAQAVKAGALALAAAVAASSDATMFCGQTQRRTQNPRSSWKSPRIPCDGAGPRRASPAALTISEAHGKGEAISQTCLKTHSGRAPSGRTPRSDLPEQ
jgi:hypothetical protein